MPARRAPKPGKQRTAWLVPLTTEPDASWQPVPSSARVLAFPWEFVTHDNHRLIPANNRRGLVASREYRLKKREAATLAALQWGPADKLSGDISLVARCYFPDKRRRDAGNYRKMITDALTGTVYTDDSQLTCETWRRAGYDTDTPRIEVLIYPALTSAARQAGRTEQEGR